MLESVQGVILLAIWVLTLAIKGYALIDCLRRPAPAFPAVGRLTKVVWIAITALAFLTGLLPSLTLGIVGIAGLVAALVYLLDVRTRIVDITGGR